MAFRHCVMAMIAVLAGLLAVPVSADEAIGAFLVVDSVNDTIFLKGELGPDSPLDFRRALQARPDAIILMLDSDGGLASSGILVGQAVRERGMDTYVPREGHCFAACSFVFLAGHSRIAEGQLGVHQLSSDVEDVAGVQYSVADVIDNLMQFDAPPQFISRMLRTPADTIYVFSPDELKSLKINQVATDGAAANGMQAAAADNRPAPVTPGAVGQDDDNTVSISTTTSSVRIALYRGLDFYGADISKGHARDLVECSKACLGESSCQSFTFNADPNIKTGPNCFVKGGYDRLEAYKNALSGLVLRSSDEEPPDYSFSAIDPTVDIVTGMSISGSTIGSGPTPGLTSLGSCRMACLDRQECQAFSYKSSTKQCWLRSSVAETFPSKGYSSAVKRDVTIRPSDVTEIEP